MSSTTTDDLYDVLGVAENAGDEEIRRNYKRLAKDLHPDRFVGDLEAQEEAQGRFAKVSNAYNVLKDPQARSEYDFERRMMRQRSLDEGVEVVDAPVEETGYKREMGDRQFRAALQLQSAGDLERAIEAVKAATELCPNVAQYRALLGALYDKRGWKSYAKAELEQALRLAPDDHLSKKLYKKVVGQLVEQPQDARASKKKGKKSKRTAARRKTDAAGLPLKGTQRFRKKRTPFWLALFNKLWRRSDAEDR